MSGTFQLLPDKPRQEGKHYTFDDLEFWAEDGVICIIDTRDGEATAVSCKEFVFRAKAIREEASHLIYASDRKRNQDCILNMYEAWKEAKRQGDPADPNVVKERLKARRKAILVTGFNW